MAELSARLLAIKSFVTKGSRLADVGSDHALLPISLIGEGICPLCQAIENKKGPYEGMKKAIEEAGLKGRIVATYGDGLDKLLTEINEVAVCGMGGHLILKILQKGKSKLAHVGALVLDPHRDEDVLRGGLLALGYVIVREEIVEEEGVFYTIIKAEKGGRGCVYEPKDLLFGPLLRKERGEAFVRMWTFRLKKLEEILQNEALPSPRRQECLKMKQAIKEELGI